jgi:hypothetical protein
MVKPIGRKFSPSTVLFGVGLIAAGALVLLLFHYVLHVMPLVVVIGALLALPAGVACILFSFVPACLNCNKELQVKTLKLAPSARAALKQAYEHGSVKDMLAVMSTNAGSKEAGAIRLNCWSCPQCQAVGYLKATELKERPISGPDVRSVLAAMSA